MEISAVDAMDAVVSIAAANLSFLQARLAEVDGLPLETAMPLYELQVDAVDRLGRWSKAALDADLSGRQAAIAERQGRAITAALQAAFEAVGADAELRQRVVQAFGERLRPLEHAPVHEGLRD
jgi:hypothetical protein